MSVTDCGAAETDKIQWYDFCSELLNENKNKKNKIKRRRRG